MALTNRRTCPVITQKGDIRDKKVPRQFIPCCTWQDFCSYSVIIKDSDNYRGHWRKKWWGKNRRTETTLSLPQFGHIVLLKVRDGERHACSNRCGHHWLTTARSTVCFCFSSPSFPTSPPPSTSNTRAQEVSWLTLHRKFYTEVWPENIKTIPPLCARV